jgi:hypothetical protein
MNNKIRYYDIDWLRVLGMITIFLFHNARFFNDEGWHVKNFQTDSEFPCSLLSLHTSSCRCSFCSQPSPSITPLKSGPTPSSCANL